jgi:type I restriction enzyme S subunit
MKNISKPKLMSVTIPFVSISLQTQFAKKIETIEKQKILIKSSIAETQKLFDYTMDKYFG